MKPELKQINNESAIITELCEELGKGWDHEKSFKMLKAVLNAIRERLNVEESVSLLRAMPFTLKCFYVDGWVVSEAASEGEDDFIEAVGKRADIRSLGDLNILKDLPLAVESVLRVIRRNLVTDGNDTIHWVFPYQMDYMLEEGEPLFI